MKKTKKEEEAEKASRRKNAQLNKVKWHEDQWQEKVHIIVYVSVCLFGFTIKAWALCSSQLSCTISKSMQFSR